MGKSRLAPIKTVLKLKPEKMSRNEISLSVTQSFFCTDSTCVLRNIANTVKRFQTFVVNRIASIYDVSSPSQRSYVDIHSNPADEASRGVPVGLLERWIKGPEFLKNPPDAWSQRHEELGPSIPDSDPEIKQNSIAYAISSQARDSKVQTKYSKDSLHGVDYKGEGEDKYIRARKACKASSSFWKPKTFH